MSTTIIPIRIPQPQMRVIGGPVFADATSEGSGGQTKINENWQYPLWKYTLRYIREKNEAYDGFLSLLSFYANYHGSYFLFRDEWDCTDEGLGKIVQIGSDWRLVKDYPGVEPRKPGREYVAGDYVRPLTPNGYYYVATVGGVVTGPEPTWPTSAGTVTDGDVTWKFVDVMPYKRRIIYRPIEGTYSDTGDGTIDYTTGILAGRTSGAGTWTGSFDVPVQFTMQGDPQFERDPGQYVEWTDVGLREVRVS